jgi:TolA-binding protein
VGFFYLRKGSVSAALGRFTDMEQRFPEYAGRDKLFFYSARALERLGRAEEASRYYAQLIEKYPDSEYAKRARDKKEEKPTRAASTPVETAPQ